jgi:hypothetical protein
MVLALRALAVLALALTLAGCLASEVDVEGKRCDLEHLCPEGFTCRVDRCQSADAGAPDAG